MAGAPDLYFTEQGHGSPLLLIHGLMVTGEMFEHVLPHLSAQHRVIVPDLRGHGQSRGLGPPYTVARLAADVSTLLARLAVPSAAVLGYSQGGSVAQQLAIAHPEQCSRLVLGCSYAFNMSSVREKLEAVVTPVLMRTLGMKRFAKLVFSMGMGDTSDHHKTRLGSLIAGQDLDLMVAAWTEAMAFDSRARLEAIRCPTLVLAGANDTAVPMHHANELQGGIRGSRLEVIEGAGHGLIWSHSDEFLQRVDTFLAETASAAAPGP